MEELRDFAENVTMHGIFRILRSKKLAVKSFWVILFLDSAAYLVYQVVETSKSFMNYNVNYKIQSRVEKKMQFPSVTICPTDAYSKSYTWENAVNETAMKEIIKNTDKGSSVIWAYDFEAETYTYPKHFRSVLIPGVGLCYTFNPDGDVFQYNAGIYNGLNMLVFVSVSDGKRERQLDPTNGKGVLISIHDPGEFPFPTGHGIGLAPGFSNIIALNRRTTIRKEWPYVSNCTHAGNANVLFPGKYSLTNCVYSCQEIAALKICGLLYEPLTIPYLSKEQKSCYHEMSPQLKNVSMIKKQ